MEPFKLTRLCFGQSIYCGYSVQSKAVKIHNNNRGLEARGNGLEQRATA